jgi:hypothetical protein
VLRLTRVEGGRRRICQGREDGANSMREAYEKAPKEGVEAYTYTIGVYREG